MAVKVDNNKFMVERFLEQRSQNLSLLIATIQWLITTLNALLKGPSGQVKFSLLLQEC